MWALLATDAIARLTSKTTQNHDFAPFGDQITDGDTQVRGISEDGLGVLLEVLHIPFYFGPTTSAPFQAAPPSRAGLAQPTIPRSCQRGFFAEMAQPLAVMQKAAPLHFPATL
jgi:hypothetical protein